MLGNPVTAEVSIEDESHRTWLWLGPIDGGVELRRVQQPRGVDPGDWSAPSHDPQVVERATFPDLEAALAERLNQSVDTDAFEAIWKMPNPF
jgi:hypothetical protein